ncbi:MAG: type 1 glutamine amidotransferase [Ktedonobacterales bacterium]
MSEVTSTLAPDEQPALTLAHLYPDQLNMYGDRGNIITLTRRCAWRGISLRVVALDLGEPLDPAAYDLLFVGGGQDKEQSEVARDLREVKGDGLRAAVEADVPLLAVCGGYQLLAHYYRPADGPDLLGAGIFDAWTVHSGKHLPRCTGNVALAWGEAAPQERGTLVGFENHGGRTYLGPTARPLGRVLAGHGNNSEDGYEGAVYRNAYGTYLHGSLLPKNPHLADHLLRIALARRHGAPAAERLLAPLDDAAEWQAHESMLARLGAGTESRRTGSRRRTGALAG